MGMAQANAEPVTTTFPPSGGRVGAWRLLARLRRSAVRIRPGRPRFGWVGAGFFALMLAALGLRLFELDGRTMHYDEAIHVHYAWKLANGEGFLHSPWMHGPFQVELAALIFKIFGDTDFTARLGYILFGTALVGLPYFLRDYLGRTASLLAGVMLTLSPTLLYFSRFGRNDIIMVFWVTALLILMWRYVNEGRHRYLYLASAVLALMFATKETSYLVVAIFGALMFLLALPDLVPWVLGRVKTSQLGGAAGFLLLLLTLTLPQWSALSGIFLDPFGLNLVSSEGDTAAIVGAPQWAGPQLILPVYHFAWWLHALAAALLVGIMVGISWPWHTSRRVMLGTALPLGVMTAAGVAMFRPLGELLSWRGVPVADFALAGILVVAAIVAMVLLRYSWKRVTMTLLVPASVALVYSALFTNLVNVDGVVRSILPSGISVDAGANGIPVNFLVAGGVLLAAVLISIYLGVSWRGGVWVACAAIFYLIWIALYTTLFTNFAGVFSGVWQGLGYWMEQQDVARGNQPWYYYFVGLPVYELLAVFFGALGAVYFLRKWDPLGLVLAFWALATLAAYTIASEKMPWILVNLALPLILLSAKYLGDLVEMVPWRRVLRQGLITLLVLPPLALAAGVYLLYNWAESTEPLGRAEWALIISTGLLVLASAYLIRLARPGPGLAMSALGLAVLLLGFGTVGAFRAAYTYDDSNVEILVYAQGSSDLQDTYGLLDSVVFQSQPEAGSVGVDYDLWYPFQWYVREAQTQGILRFSCFKHDSEDGWDSNCNQVPDEPDSRAYLLTVDHANRNGSTLRDYQRDGPLRNLLWFPESYRRPNENRQGEGFTWGFRGIPSKHQLSLDFKYFKDVATSRESWFMALDYLFFRNLEQDWYNSEYYSYLE